MGRWAVRRVRGEHLEQELRLPRMRLHEPALEAQPPSLTDRADALFRRRSGAVPELEEDEPGREDIRFLAIDARAGDDGLLLGRAVELRPDLSRRCALLNCPNIPE